MGNHVNYGGLVIAGVGFVLTRFTDGGSTVTVELPLADPAGNGLRFDQVTTGDVRPAVPQLFVTLVAVLIAGVSYGIAAEALGGSVGFIGVYYGVQNPVVGWIAHEFHSVVFAFASLVSLAPARYPDWMATYVVVGTAWGLVLWFVAAGFISPIWLSLVGISAPIPSLSEMLLVSHLAWGSSLGVLTAVGYRYIVP